MAQKLISVTPEVYERIKALAEASHRTIMGEVAYLLEYYLTLEAKAESEPVQIAEA